MRAHVGTVLLIVLLVHLDLHREPLYALGRACRELPRAETVAEGELVRAWDEVLRPLLVAVLVLRLRVGRVGLGHVS